MKVIQLSPDCGVGPCPTVFQVSPECGIGTCPAVFDKEGDLIIIGSVLTQEELGAIEHKVEPGRETAVRVPKSLIASLKF